MTIYFYKEHGPLGYLASYSNHGFYIDGIFYKTVEHYYQSQKFLDLEIRTKIINASTPKEASNMGRDKTLPLRQDWEKLKNAFMYVGVYEKFKQNKDIQKLLLETNDSDIVEETTKENYWGCGPLKDGKNIFGQILCKVRNELKLEEDKKQVL